MCSSDLDKNELYLLCVQTCFQALTAYLERELRSFSGTAEARVQHFVGAQVRFFGENPRYLGIFCDASLRPPEELREEILSCRAEFEKLNLSVLSGLLKEKPLRASLSPQAAAEDYLGYLQYFHHEETVHERDYVAEEHIYPITEFEVMKADVKSIMSDEIGRAHV